jgi:hypothetical protein
LFDIAGVNFRPLLDDTQVFVFLSDGNTQGNAGFLAVYTTDGTTSTALV